MSRPNECFKRENNQMRNWYLAETSCVYQARKFAAIVMGANKGYTVLREDEDGWRVCTLVLIPPQSDQKPFELTEAERSRLEAQFNAAKTKRQPNLVDEIKRNDHQLENIKRHVGTIDLTPTWRSILPMLLAGIQDGNAVGKKIAIEELRRMAEAADLYNASIPKETKE